jgi:hypothetical protein
MHTERDQDEAAFFGAALVVSDFLRERHNIKLEFSNDERGRLVLHCEGFRDMIVGARQPPPGPVKPHFTIYLTGGPTCDESVAANAHK